MGGSKRWRLENYRKNRVCDAFTDTLLVFEEVQTEKMAGRFKNGVLKIKRRNIRIRQRGEKTL
jgi:HSP20 family molecular chaperone IbpA